jgi:hypothetical protein
MKRIILFIALVLIVAVSGLRGQKATGDAPAVLENLYSRLLNSHSDLSRLQINDSIKYIIESFLSSDTVFKYNFKNLRYLGQITSPDSSLKIITWNLILPDSPGRYFCYFIRKGSMGKENKIYRLSALYKNSPITLDTTYTQADWYGALYYDVRPFIIDNKKCWILLGIDYGNPDISRKIIDVLNISSGDSILLGRKLFESGGKNKFRAVFEYASQAMISLRFKSDSSIVFDHLVPFSPSQKDDRQFYGPDYSNDAYNYSKGLWRLIINVDARNSQ